MARSRSCEGTEAGATRQQHPASRIRVLNLFAYTGGASMAAKAAGADVIHVDSVKPVINWAREDMEISGLDGIRWVIEDAMKFVRREVKRGNRYDGIILDPPAYGRGPDGEKWILEESIDEMMALCAELLSPKSSVGSSQLAVGSTQFPFFILSLYSMGFSSLIGENLVRSYFKNFRELQSGELCFPDRAGRNLPLGTYARFL
ncbi:MAG: class I SAM-dependent methyltransferase [Bacteroidia bacterium]|nr:class I SAM-dependent methyltransferase [Bacteroidia bacterium]